MKILVVHEIDYLEKVIYEIHEFPEMLSAAGHDVTFFHFQEGASRRKGNLFRQKMISGRVVPNSQIKLVGPHQFGIPSIDRLWATLSCIPALVKLFRSSKFDVVLNFAVPTYGLQVLGIARMFGVPVVHRALDVSHEIRESIYRLPILYVEKIIYRIVGTLSANNAAMKRYCEELSGRSKPSMVNYPPLDLAHFAGITRDAGLRSSLGIFQEDKVIAYMGSFFYFSGLPEVIKRFKEKASGSPELKLLLIGGGEQDKELRDLVSDLHLENSVIFTGFVPYAELPKYLRQADVAINPLKISQVSSVAFPHKVLQYLATGLAVISTRLEGLVSAIDGIGRLHWVESSEACLDLAFELSKTSAPQLEKSLVNEQLEGLFAPERALESLTKTLELAIKAQQAK